MQDESNICEPCVVFAPLSQLKVDSDIDEGVMDPLIKHGLLFTKMEHKLRRAIIEKSKSAKAADQVLELLLESELIFWCSIPQPLPPALQKVSFNVIRLISTIYSLIAGEILKRIYNCLMIFNLHRHGPTRECWFCANGSPNQINFETIEIIDSQWKPDDFPYYGVDDPRFDKADVSIKALGIMWDRFLPFLKIDEYKAMFTDETKWNGYLKAAEVYSKHKAEEFAVIRSDETGKTVEPIGQILEGEIYDGVHWWFGDIYDGWWFDGVMSAFGRAVKKLDFNLEKGARGRRLIRALQFLSTSIMLPDPYQFISKITCLECLFSKEPAEVTHQLATRTAWFLYPDEPVKRYDTYNNVISLYKIRSNIVHGRTYDIGNEGDNILNCETIIRLVLMKILSDDEILKLIFDKDPSKYDKYLASLSLGKTDID